MKTYSDASDRPSGLTDSGGYWKLDGTSSGTWYKGWGVTAGMSVADVARKHAAKGDPSGTRAKARRWRACPPSCLSGTP